MKVHNIEQRSPQWYSLRCGLPTASEFSRIVTSTGEPSKSASGYALTLAAERYAGRPIEQWEGNGWTERGREMEAPALELYAFATDRVPVPVGFVTNDAGTIGCSPDSFIGDDGLIEVKALKAERHIGAILYYRKHGRCPPDYVQQAQGQMLICEREWCDLVFYHPELPLLIIRQVPDEAIRKGLLAGIPLVCAERDQVLAALHAQAKAR